MLACKVKLPHKSQAAQGVRLKTADLMRSVGGGLEEFAAPLRNLCCKPVVEPEGERAGKLQLQTGSVKLYCVCIMGVMMHELLSIRITTYSSRKHCLMRWAFIYFLQI